MSDGLRCRVRQPFGLCFGPPSPQLASGNIKHSLQLSVTGTQGYAGPLTGPGPLPSGQIYSAMGFEVSTSPQMPTGGSYTKRSFQGGSLASTWLPKGEWLGQPLFQILSRWLALEKGEPRAGAGLLCLHTHLAHSRLHECRRQQQLTQSMLVLEPHLPIQVKHACATETRIHWPRDTEPCSLD